MAFARLFKSVLLSKLEQRCGGGQEGSIEAYDDQLPGIPDVRFPCPFLASHRPKSMRGEKRTLGALFGREWELRTARNRVASIARRPDGKIDEGIALLKNLNGIGG